MILQRQGLGWPLLPLLLLLLWCPHGPTAGAWDFFQRDPLLTRELCNKASHGHVWDPPQAAFPPLKKWLGVDGPVLQIPDKLVDITTVNTLVQLVTPGLKLVLDPLMYLRSMSHEGTIPKVIHMTMRSKHKVAPHQVLSILSWGKLNHGYTLLMYDDSDMEQYMKLFFPKFMDVYRRLTTPVERSDAWRYHVLCRHGGVYADTDTICARAFDTWLTPEHIANLSSSIEPGIVVGIENVFPSQEAAEEATYVRKVQMIQWTMAAKRSHPVVCGMGLAIRRFVDREETEQLELDAKMGHDATILLRTGPGIWTDAVQTYLQELQGSLDNMIAGGQLSDVVVLPQAALGCNVRFWATNNVDSVVYHMYNNSWKKDHFSVANQRIAARRQAEVLRRQEFMRRVVVVAAIVSAVGYALYVVVKPLLPGGASHGGAVVLPVVSRKGAARKRVD